jgi:hypothetical protein
LFERCTLEQLPGSFFAPSRENKNLTYLKTICAHLRTTAMDGGSANPQGAMIGKSADKKL